MSEGIITATESTPSIHDAIDALFAQKDAEAAKVQPAVVADVAPSADAPAADTEAAVDAEAPVVEAAPVVEVPKVTASDYALKLARLKKQQAAAPAPQTQRMPSAELIAKAQAIESAGGDPLKAFEAAGFDLATVVQAYDKALNENPAEYDPLAKEVKRLAQELDQYKKREETARTTAAIQSFENTVAKHVSENKAAFKYVAAHGPEGISLVKEIVLAAGETGRVLQYVDALKKAEDYYAKKRKIFLEADGADSKPQTTKPGIPQQGSAAAAAPTARDAQPKPVSDVIADSIDALFAGRA